MNKPQVTQTDTFDEWRQKTNQISQNIGDLDQLITLNTSNLVDAVNEVAVKAEQVTAPTALIFAYGS